jgi:DNA replication ATP-dependent helicase Dna2
LGVDRRPPSGDEAQQVILKLGQPRELGLDWLTRQAALAQVTHAYVAPLLGWGVAEDGRWFCVRPRTLAEPLPLWAKGAGAAATQEDRLRLLLRVCEAVEAAHARGLPHLALKPSNILVRGEGEGASPWVVDFGAPPHEAAAMYAAPEILRGACTGTLRADLYALGLLALNLIRGGEGALEADFHAAQLSSWGERWHKRLEERADQLPAFLGDAVKRAVSPDPRDRHLSVEEFARELRAGLYRSSGLTTKAAARPGRGAATGDSADVRDGLIESLGEVDGPKGRALRFALRHRDGAGEWTKARVFFYADERGDPGQRFLGLDGAWRGAEVSLYSAVQVRKGDELFYSAGEETLPVLEPYFPVRVTDVVKAQGCVTRYLVDLRDSGNTGEAQVVGNIVHGLLERLARGGVSAESLERHKQEEMGGYRLELLAAGVGQKDMGRVEQTVDRHLARLQEIAQQASRSPFEGALTEVKRTSGEYGLEGRTDLAFDDGRSFRILELKTGKTTDSDAQQTRCYMLMWDKVAERHGREVTGEILYSRNGELVRVHRQDHNRERQILKARNAVVAHHRHEAFGDVGDQAPYYHQFKHKCAEEACLWKREKCQLQSGLLGRGPGNDSRTVTRPKGVWEGVDPDLVDLARAYHRHFVRLVEAEAWAGNAQMGQIMRGDGVRERVAAHRAAAGLVILELDPEQRRLVLGGEGLQVFGQDAEVSLHRGDFHREQPINARVVKATVERVELTSPALGSLLHAPREGWILDALPARLGYREAQRALLDLLRVRDPWRLRLLLRREAPPAAVHAPAWVSELDHLNERQREAVVEAVHCRSAYLIQGPPGTGKTTVIAEIVHRLVERGERVLLSAATNSALDNILSRLVQTGATNFLRFGSARDSQLARELALSCPDPWARFTDDLAERVSDLDELKRRVVQTKVFAATTHKAGGHAVIEILEREQGFLRGRRRDIEPLFDVAILDEASQVTEPLALGAIHRARRFILVGDHQQLPPVITAERALSAHLAASPPSGPRSAAEQALVEQGGVGGLDRSLFERLIERLPHTRLVEQYRMNEALMAFSSRQFYDGAMISAEEVQSLRLPVRAEGLEGLAAPLRALLDPASPLVLAHVRGAEDHHQNLAEAEVVLRVLGALLEGDLLEERFDCRPMEPSKIFGEVGVISPFKAQVQLLRTLIAGRFPEWAEQIEVDTVERFQGREKEVMLVSFVAATRASSFLGNARRLNVTMTRARSKLILLGDLDALATSSPLLRALIEQPESRVVRVTTSHDRGA